MFSRTRWSSDELAILPVAAVSADFFASPKKDIFRMFFLFQLRVMSSALAADNK